MSRNPRHVYEFDSFVVDLEERCLESDGEVVPLTARSFDLLVALVEGRGRVLTKDELLETVWTDSVVEEANLTVGVYALRRALGDSATEPRYIETIPKRGYRFIADVAETTDEIAPPDGARPVAPSQTVVRAVRPARRAALVVLAAVVVVAVAAVVYTATSASAPAPHAVDPAARVAYLRGRHFWNQRTANGLSKSIAYYRRALEIDPDYALAYAGIADSYVFDLADWPKASAAARKALELDPSLAAPHASLGFGLMFHQWDWAGAERELLRAIELDPSYATAHQWYATWLEAHGRLEEARAELDRAEQLDPTSASIVADLAELAYFEHDYDRAVARAREALDLDPEMMSAHLCLVRAYERQGKDAEWMAARREMAARTTYGEAAVEDDRAAFAAGGMNAAIRRDVERSIQSPGMYRYEIARQYAILGETDHALDWLERAVEHRGFFLVYVRVDPVFEPLRRTDRYREIERRVGLAP